MQEREIFNIQLQEALRGEKKKRIAFFAGAAVGIIITLIAALVLRVSAG